MRPYRVTSLVCIAAVTTLCSGSAVAQARRAADRAGDASTTVGAELADAVRIRGLEGVGRRGLVKTPEYQTSVTRSSGVKREWAQIVLRYETRPEWIDALTIKYYVLGMIEKNGRNVYSLYENAVRYVDIAQGRDHMGTVFLHPNALERFGEVVAAAVEVVYEGKPLAEESVVDTQLPEKWWKNPAVVNSDALTKREGYLLDRSQSPFAHINIDDFEVIR